MKPVHIVNINTDNIKIADPFTINVDDLNGVTDLTDYFNPFDKFGKNSNEETLEKIPMKDIENFLRKKKLKNINNKHE